MPELTITHLISQSTLQSAIRTHNKGKGVSGEDLSYWLNTFVSVANIHNWFFGGGNG